MRFVKTFLAFLLFAVGLLLLAGVTQAADNSLTFGLPMLFGVEYEGAVSDRFSFCLDLGAYPAAGVDMSAYSLGGKYYFGGGTMDGAYAGIQLGTLNGSGKLLGIFDIDIDNQDFAQVRFGYKKALPSGFTYDLGIYGVVFDHDDSGVGVTALIGYSW